MAARPRTRSTSRTPASKKTTRARKPTTLRAKPTAKVATKAPATTARVSTHPPKKRTAESRAIIARVARICLALPGATEVPAWGEPTWRVGGKIFAQFDDHHHGADHVAVWLPAPEGAQADLIDAEPARIFRPPYVGHKGWIGVYLHDDPDWAMVEALIAQAHSLIARKRR